MALRKDIIEIVRDAPFPDVLAPLNDDLRLLAGFAPFDQLTTPVPPLNLLSKSLSFQRASTATYIAKGGLLKIAEVNEPRFEHEGLLIEGQSSNILLNSTDPSKWNTTASMTRTVLPNDGNTQAVTLKAVVNTSEAYHSLVTSSNITLAAGEAITLSCRAKGNYGLIRLAFTLAGVTKAAATFDIKTGVPNSVPAGITVTSVMGNDGYSNVSATLTVDTPGVYAGVIVTQKANADVGSPVDSEFYVQMPQCEKNTVATSYIPTGAAAVTRASETCTLQAPGNCGYRLTGDLFERTAAFELTVNAFATPALGYHSAIASTGAGSDIILRMVSDSLNSLRSGSGILPVVSVTYPIDKQIFVQTIDKSNKLSVYFGDKTGTRTAPPAVPENAPTVITMASHSNVVYHVRNFRIWHKALTTDQIRGLS